MELRILDTLAWREIEPHITHTHVRTRLGPSVYLRFASRLSPRRRAGAGNENGRENLISYTYRIIAKHILRS